MQHKNIKYFCFRFTEMPTNNYVESSFWNFDALFQPQQHPARDAHDTFFVSGILSQHNILEKNTYINITLVIYFRATYYYKIPHGISRTCEDCSQ